MRGISEEKIKSILSEFDSKTTHHNDDFNSGAKAALQSLVDTSLTELQEPWIPIDEFLKSGFEGLCWAQDGGKEVTSYHYFNGRFLGTRTGHQIIRNFTKVQPINKPEPPR